MNPDMKQLQDRVAKLEAQLDYFLRPNKYYFQRNIELGNGSTIGVAANSKVGFFGTTPVVKPATVTLTGGGASIDGNARIAIAGILSLLQSIGLMT